ncbi:hypothetical protein C3L33_23109, partial [Rhododendron williamsianum]
MGGINNPSGALFALVYSLLLASLPLIDARIVGEYSVTNLRASWDDIPEFYSSADRKFVLKPILVRTNPGVGFVAGFWCSVFFRNCLFSILIFPSADYLQPSDRGLVWSANRNKPCSSIETHEVWQSFDHPTDTLLLGQNFSLGQKLIASVSSSNWSQEWKFQWFGWFQWVVVSSCISTAQFMKLEPDGHLMVYQGVGGNYWNATANLLEPYVGDCEYPLACGKYGVCSKGQCSCPPGEAKNGTSLFRQEIYGQPNQGCSPITPISCNSSQYHSLLELQNISYSGNYNQNGYEEKELEDCKKACLNNCSCKGFLFRYGSAQGCLLLSEVLTLVIREAEGFTSFRDDEDCCVVLQSDFVKRPPMSVVVKVLEGLVDVETNLDYNFTNLALPRKVGAASLNEDVVHAANMLLPSTLSGPRQSQLREVPHPSAELWAAEGRRGKEKNEDEKDNLVDFTRGSFSRFGLSSYNYKYINDVEDPPSPVEGSFVQVAPFLYRRTNDTQFLCGFSCNFDGTECLFSVLMFQNKPNSSSSGIESPQLVWSTNRDSPVKASATLLLTGDGGLVVGDVDGAPVWSTNISSKSVPGITLTALGNLELFDENNDTVWESVDHPTDTLVEGQTLYSGMELTASTSTSNWRKGMLSRGIKAPRDSAYGLFILPGSAARFMKLGPDGHFRLYEWGDQNEESVTDMKQGCGVTGRVEDNWINLLLIQIQMFHVALALLRKGEP